MAGLFAKAASKKAASPAKKKDATMWRMGQNQKIASAIHEFVQLEAKKKAIDAQMGIFKTILKNAGEENYLRDFSTLGVPPETPMKLVNEEGESVTYVVTDRCASTKVSDEQVEEIVAMFGEDGAKEIVFEQSTFKFDPVLMAIPGVQDVIEAALGEAVARLTSPREVDGKELPPLLTEQMAENLIECDQIRAFKPQTIKRMAEICGRSVTRMKDLLSAMGSACVRYVS